MGTLDLSVGYSISMIELVLRLFMYIAIITLCFKGVQALNFYMTKKTK